MDRWSRRLTRGLAVALGGAMLGVAALSPAAAQETPLNPAPTHLDITVTAEVLESNAPIEVETTDVTTPADLYAHGVVVTWTGTQDAVLGDERFTHHVTAEEGEGDLVIAGRGCGASWSEQEQEVIFPCTLDLRIVEVSPGDSHEYPVTIHHEVGPLTLEPGTYVVDQVITWWYPGAEEEQQQSTVRLTYQVEEADDTAGSFTPAPAASGVTIAVWSGGPASELPQADSYWVTVDGKFVPYVPASPAFANAAFMALFPNDIPAGTMMLIVR